MLFETFNEAETILEYENLKPKLGKSSHTFRVDKIVVHFIDLNTQKPFKIGSKHLGVQLFEINEEGNFTALKKGIKRKPLETISTIVHLVKEFAKTNKPESVQFRFDNSVVKDKKDLILKSVSRLIKKHFEYQLLPGIVDGKCFYIVGTNNIDSLISDDFIFTSSGYLSKTEKLVLSKQNAVSKSIRARYELIDDATIAETLSRRINYNRQQ